MDEKIYTVTAITRLIKHTLEESFDTLWVEGEVSNYVHHSSGHRYLTLKDENAALRVTVWRSAGQYLKFEPENGMKIRACGDISVYEKGGSYQLNARKLTPVGVGELEVAFRQLYEKLDKEGLFDPSRKKPLPDFPATVGIVTSPTGAAIRDIITVARRRNDAVKLIIYPAQVQGDGAELTIKAGIEYFNTRDDVDVIITGRGGGSLEDLWAFNEEVLVRAIAASHKPIVSAIGHEIDTTLSDLAADLRAPTPSAAAELVIWNKNEFLRDIADRVERAGYALGQTVASGRERLRRLVDRPVYRRPETLVREREQTLDTLLRVFESAGKNSLEKPKNALSLAVSRLESLSPLAILKRGYAVIRDAGGDMPIKTVDDLRAGQEIESILADGFATAIITDVTKRVKSI
ncbi:MAG: exodeoxyribonuclease VII large subunit [candidate division Zixibacteria bacterium]|nr:exodeoxyribonuclease VII large subunit [candidate division Zixibacteria bacterium]